jgi:predicted RNA-binding protein YlxR (DUF448 family)
MAIKHVPMRTCIGTGEQKPKNELIRLVRRPDGSVVIDLRGKERGRGASLCADLAAFDLAVKKRAINRSLKLEKPLTVEQLADLRKLFEAAIAEKAFRPNNKSVTVKVSKQELESKLSTSAQEDVPNNVC